MATLNKLTLIGNLGKDPESRSTKGNKTFATFSIATEDYVGKDDNGKAQTKTTWFNITVFGRSSNTNGIDPQVDWVLKNLKKGHQVYVEGPISISTSEKDGKTYTNVNVIANQVLLSNVRGESNGSSNGSSNSSNESQNGQSSQGNQTRQTATSAPVSEPQDATYSTAAGASYDDTDLPF